MAIPPKGKAKAKPAAVKKPASPSGKATTSRAKAKPVDSGQKYVVSGTVTYADSTPAVGLTVIAYDKDMSGKDNLGQPVVTTESGTFAIPYSDADFRRTKEERGGADVIVCIYNAEKELLFTSKKQNNAPANYELNIKLPAQPFVVRGTVTDANHKPLANLTVRAFERDLRHPQLLGTATTDTNGDYRVEYHLAAFLLGDVPARRTPWLIVEVLERADGKVLAKQEVQKAAPDQTISFTLTNVGAVSEWQRVNESAPPLLKGQGTPRIAALSHVENGKENPDLHPADLTATDVDFIVLETGLDRAAVQAWAASSSMLRDALLQLTEEYPAQQVALRENGWPFFFGIARQGRTNDLGAVLRESAESLNQALKAAAAAHRIPPLNEKQVEVLLAVLKLLQGLQQLDPARSGNSDFARVLASLSTPLPKIVALDALTIVQEKGLDDVDALLELTKRHPNVEAPIMNFVRGVRVHQLTSGDEGLSRALNARLEGGASDSIAPLAAMMSADWISAANETSTSPGQALRMLAHVEKQHPLTALQAKFIVGNVTLPGVTGGEIAALVKNDGVTVAAILQGKKRVKDTDANVPAAHKKLRDLGRFMRTGISMELGADLMNADIGTPGKALRYGREYIYEKHRERLPKKTAREITDSFFDATERTVNGGNGLMADIQIDRAHPAWMVEEVPIALPDAVRENLPTLPGLFGDLDECICKPCDSMLGQPAYLVDLLNLLGENLRAKLKLKRLGIFTLKLSCENADTEKTIQHIDIVLEVLQEAVGTDPYEITASAVYPWRLPFSLPYAEVKAYLAKLGVSRFDLLSLLSNPQAKELAAATLDITFPQQWALSEWRLLTVKRTGTELWQVYGLASFPGSSFPLADPASGEDISREIREEVVSRASVLIKLTGLELDDLEKVLSTKFVSGIEGELRLSNRNQCKTSEMLVRAKASADPSVDVLRPVFALEGCLDRLHRFTRLHAKLPGWSITQLDKAIGLCGGIEMEVLVTPQNREDLLVKLAVIKRLNDDHGIPLEHLFDLPASTERFRKSLGLSGLQFSLVKEVTALVLTPQFVNWAELEKFCNAVKSIRESGLSVAQVAEALLPQGDLARLEGELPPTIKTDKQIEKLLEATQQRLRSVVAIRTDQTLESQAIEALSEIFDATTADKLVKAIRDAGAATPVAPGSALRSELESKLSVTTNPIRSLGEWLPLLTDQQARDALTVILTPLTSPPTPPTNPSTDTRFEDLLQAIADRRRERELIKVVAEQCGLDETEVTPLLGSRLLLDPPTRGQHTQAAEVFLDTSFWADIPSITPSTPSTPPTQPSMALAVVPRLHAWMDRLYRLIPLCTALNVDRELMLLADRIVVDTATTQQGIHWSEMLATPPATGSIKNWQALLDLVWLQQPEQISRPTLNDLMNRLENRGNNSVQAQTLRPLATRLSIAEAQTLGIAGQAVSTSNARNLRNPTQLRRAFELLLLARHLGASDTQLTHLANLQNKVQAATTAKALLQARISEQEHKEDWRSLNDKLLQQRRDALVAYLVGNKRLAERNYKEFRNANDLYEYYLIDPQMEPCFETTRVLEAITATQLFAQRLLFGLEAGQVASKELKDRWTWMRNYRVWEANRKVFLFPENWLFPELRDDKSSSFKQLESALGQGELNQELAVQSFGQFLDDVAQMGQVQVLGMYEDLSLDSAGRIEGVEQADKSILPNRRTLYVVGRTLNPPYAYFWRKCVDFGRPYMEWSPWQRIELDIQGDHVLPFVINRQLIIVWPLMNRSEQDANGESALEIKFNWSRHDGVRWHQPQTSRDEMVLTRAERFDERQGVHLEGFVTKQQQEDSETRHNVAILNVYTKSKYALESSIPTAPPRKVVTSGTFSSFVASSRYIKITRKTRLGNNYVQIRPIPINADTPPVPGSSAELVITWTCWIKVKQYSTDPNPKYLKLTSPTIRPIVLAAIDVPGLPAVSRVPFMGDDPCQLGTDGRFLCVNTFYKASGDIVEKSYPGSLPTGNWQVNATFDGSMIGVQLSSDSIETPAVAVGKSTAATLVFEIDASAYTIAELGLEDLVPSQFERRGSFEIGPDEVLRSSPLQIQLSTPTNTTCRMNGFIESQGSAASAFAIKLPPSSSASEFQVLAASAPNILYEAIPAISARQVEVGVDAELLPRIWYYREGPSNAYIDVAHGVLGRTTKFCLYPAGFSEAANYCATWRSSNALAATEDQGGLFGAHLLPLKIGGMDRATIRLDGTSSDINRAEQRKLSFDTQFPYACYNWEVFFHAPLLIADHLSKQHKFEEAEHWLRYVFNPTSPETGANADNVKRFLKFRVFNELNLNKQVIDDLTALAQAAGDFATDADIAAVEKLINRWRDAPFRPFLIARRRHIAFLWRTLFAYLDNLIAWADSLYRRDTVESINEATMLYVLAERILGRRPKLHKGSSNREALSYEDMNAKWDEFANYWIDTVTGSSNNRPPQSRLEGEKKQPNPDGMLYFCMPFNDKILSYWNTIEARLSNVRNCRNIEGIERKLLLMDAPIDPEQLIRATAAGLDLGEVIAGLYAPPPHYRYSILSARASELANEAKSLGAAMLSAIEKRDAEQLAKLRSSNEISLLKLVSEVRKLQITEADRNIDALRASRQSIGTRYSQYQRLLGKKDTNAPDEGKSVGEESMLGNQAEGATSRASALGLITSEDSQMTSLDTSKFWSDADSISRVVASVFHLSASAIHYIPNPIPTKVGEALSALGTASSTLGDAFKAISQLHQNEASHHSLMATHIRRRDEWAFQSNQTLKEMQQIDKQILANQIRIDITNKELNNHIEQIEQSKAVDEVMRSKFSNEQLYEWMKTELSKLYFSAYRMALDMARKAERAAARELGVKPLNILGNAYWDSLRDGLLAGERLHQDLKRLEITYLDQNRREYEMTKHISLRRLDPGALVKLRIRESATGPFRCKFDIPEWLFDLDTPGHYLRRIKSVSVSIPSVTGPYTSVSCKLTLLKSQVRHELTAANYPRTPDNDTDFTDYFGASEAIVTSTGNGDSGLFETNLRDERFLPFEGSGVISEWRLELPDAYPQFDYSTISDVVLSIRYTARDGGDLLRNAATSSISTLLTTTPPLPATTPLRFPVVLSCRSDFPTEWSRARAGERLKIKISSDFLPYWMIAATPQLYVRKVEYFNLIKGSTSPPTRTEIWPTTPPSGNSYTANQDGYGEADLPTVASNVTDRIVLISVGSRQ